MKQRKEAQLCLYCAVHTSIRSVDHLSDLHKDFKCEPGDTISIHRTKCTGLIRNIIGPYFSKTLKEDIGDSFYSLLIDESTDIAVQKLLGVAIRYYSATHIKIVSTFLGLIHINDGTANTITVALKSLLSKFDLDIRKLQGIGTDNASTMIGVNNGVHALLKEDQPKLILVRCICHSLQLAISRASDRTMPRNIEYLIRETYNWFSHSSIRQLTYQVIYKTLNNDEKPLKIPKVAETRWMSIENAIKQILNQWDALTAHFNIVRLSEHCFTAEVLYNMFKDNRNRVYLNFLYPIVELLQKNNKSFESSVADPTKLLTDLKNLYKTVVSKIVNPTAKVDIFSDKIENYLDPNPYLGFAFENACREFNIIDEEKSVLKQRCVNFLVELSRELKSRLPDNIAILEKMNTLSVTECLKPNKGSITDFAKEFIDDVATITQIELQWENIHSIQWSEKENTENFWSEVVLYRNAVGDNPFKELANLAFQILCLPHSNADIERVFSQMNLIKTKLRNRMLLPLLNNLLYIRYGLKMHNMCCKDYQLPENVLKAICTNKTYESNNNDFCDIADVELLGI